jgi:hypothetical protein
MTEKPKKKMNVDQFLWMQNMMDTADAMDEPEYTPMDAPFEIVDEKREIAPFSLLAPEKKELFTIHKPVRDITLEEVYTNAKKALSNITLEDYEHFKQETADLPSSLHMEIERLGFASYLFAIAQTTGYVALAILKSPHPKGTAITQAVEITTKFFKLCTAVTDKTYANKEKIPQYQHKQVDLYQQPNDKITKNLSTATEEEQSRGQLVVDEKVGNIFSYIKLYPEEVKKMGLEHINTFDLFVLFSCISIKAAGNTQTTLNIIYKTMTGKTGEVKLTEKMRQELMQSIDKLRLTPITIDATGICAKYNHKARGRYVKSCLLPVKMAGQGIVNGGYTEDVITFWDNSPLYEIARMKNNQIFSINQDIFDVPKLKANRQNLTLRQILITLVYDAGHADKVKNTILIDTLIERSGWEGKRCRLVEVVEKCLDYWIEKKYLIKKYRIQNEKNKAVKIIFDPIEN